MGGYIGGALGSTNTRVTADGESDDTDNTGVKLFTGYRFNRNFALELSYFNPGDIKESDSGVSLTVRSDFWQAALLGTVPFSDSPVYGYGRIGLDYWNAKLTGCSGSFCNTLSSDGTDLHWGLGVGWNVNNHITVRGEIEQTEIEETIVNLPTKWRVRLLSAAFIYRF